MKPPGEPYPRAVVNVSESPVESRVSDICGGCHVNTTYQGVDEPGGVHRLACVQYVVLASEEVFFNDKVLTWSLVAVSDAVLKIQ